MIGNYTSQFRDKTISGIGWSGVLQLGRQGVQFVIGVILARLLSPDDFGLIGMILVFTGFALIYSDMGFGSALIQKQDTRPDSYFSIFWINVGTGLALMLLFMALSPLIARLYGQPILAPLTMLVSTNFFIGSFKIVQDSLLRKQLEFRRLAFVNLTALVISGIAGITMALLGLGVWSLAWQSIILTGLTVILLWIVSAWRPAMRFKWKTVKELLGFSSNLLGFSSVNYWIRNADKFLVGRFLGSSALGIYSRSYSIMLLPLTTISGTIGSVLFPALSKIQDDVPRIQRLYLRMIAVVALITFPMMLGLLVVAEDFVLFLFGAQWVGMIPILQAFCIVALVQSIGTLNGNIYLSQGRTGLQFRVGGTIGLLGVIAILIGLQWGLIGVAYAYTLFTLLVAYPSIRIAVSLIDLSFIQVIKNLAGIFGCAAAMALLLWGIESLLPSDWPHWAYLAAQIPLGVAVYGALIHFFHIQAYQELKEIIREQVQSRFMTATDAVSQ
ncbi:MAG: MOP flippase family protein [Anaerolineales bacterium]|nr:MOP flippase family protein [Anaerolineales bacterium]